MPQGNETKQVHRASWCTFGVVVAIALLPSTSRAAQFLFDFGNTATDPVDDPVKTWNNVANAVATSNTGQLLDVRQADGATTAIDLFMVSRFNGENTNGSLASGLYPADATRDSFYGNTELFGTLANVTPIFKLASLPLDQLYNFTFYASRTGVTTIDNRETVYTVAGATTTQSAPLNATNNVSNTVSLNGVVPSAAGEITISLAPSANNNNANHFVYLNVLDVNTAPVPEPATATLVAGGIGALAMRRRRNGR